MPRKSKELRLRQTKELVVAYETAGIAGTPLKFMRDMSARMSRGKYPTKRQRDWLDNLIEEGVPTPKEPTALYQKMQAAREVFVNEEKDWEDKVLGDFMHREGKGWGFSEKQAALVNKLLAQSEVLKAGNHKLAVTKEMRAELAVACNLWKGYSSLWRQERPALSRARTRSLEFLAGETYIEQYHYDKVTKAVAAKLRAFKNPRFCAGDMGYTGGKLIKEIWMCTTDVYINERGEIVNDWINPVGGIVTKAQDRIGKR
jgi:hypothetical protein